jgi:hypothetical protein
MLTLTIPQATWWEGLSRPGQMILLKKRAQGLDRGLIESGQKTAQRGAMGQGLPVEEGHKGRSKRGQSLVKGQQGGLTTDGISQQDHEEINDVIGAKTCTCKTYAVLDGLEHT